MNFTPHAFVNFVKKTANAESLQRQHTSPTMPEGLRLPGYAANYIAYTSTALETRTVAGITVPSSPLITAALALARANHDDWLYWHVVRSWILGTVIADRIPQLARRDRELHSIAIILHDLGSAATGRFASPDKSIEVNSANAAVAFVSAQQSSREWDQNRKQLLWCAIALHTPGAAAVYKRPEVIATVLGIMTDFRGPAGVPGNVLTQAKWQSIAREFPRAGLRNRYVQQRCGFCRNNPETTYNMVACVLGNELGQGSSRSGNRWYDAITNPVDPE